MSQSETAVQQEYEEYLSGLAKYLNEIANKVSLFIYLKQKMDENDDDVKLAPVIFLPMTESLLVDSVISLAKLYEPSSYGNLNKFLEFVEKNTDNLNWAHGKLTKAQVQAQKALIASKETQIKNVRGQRDKYFAHHDKKYFTASDKVGADYPLSIEDVEDLVELARKIITEHTWRLKNTALMPLNKMYIISMDNVFVKLRASGHESEVADSPLN